MTASPSRRLVPSDGSVASSCPLFDDNKQWVVVDEVGVVVADVLFVHFFFLRRIIWSLHVEKSKISNHQNGHISIKNWNINKMFRLFIGLLFDNLFHKVMHG
jgi:hypothetical protein